MTTWNLQTNTPEGAGIGMISGAWARDAVARLVADAAITADANESVAFTRSLEHIESEILRAEYRDVMYSEIVDVRVVGRPADKVYTWREGDYTVEWQEKVGLKKASDFSLPSEQRGEDSVKYRSFMAAYDYDFQDLREATALSISLEAERGIAVREGWERLLEKITANGYGTADLGGFLNNASVNVDTEAAALHTLGAEALYNRIKTIVSDQVLAVKNVQGLMPNQLTVYPELFEALVNKHLSVDNTQSVMQALENYFRARGMAGFRIVSWWRTETAGAGGLHRCVLHRKDQSVARHVISVPFEQLPIYREVTGWLVPCHGRTAGVVIPKPAAVNYIDVPVA